MFWPSLISRHRELISVLSQRYCPKFGPRLRGKSVVRATLSFTVYRAGRGTGGAPGGETPNDLSASASVPAIPILCQCKNAGSRPTLRRRRDKRLFHFQKRDQLFVRAQCVC